MSLPGERSRCRAGARREGHGRLSDPLPARGPTRRRVGSTSWRRRPCRRKAWMISGEVTTATERNGTCRRMSLPGFSSGADAPVVRPDSSQSARAPIFIIKINFLFETTRCFI
jgi:hypothetical protein